MGHPRTVTAELDQALRERIQLYNVAEEELRALIAKPSNQDLVLGAWATPNSARHSVRRFLAAQQGLNYRSRIAIEALVQQVIDGRASTNGHQADADVASLVVEQPELFPPESDEKLHVDLGELLRLASDGKLPVASIDITIRLGPGA